MATRLRCWLGAVALVPLLLLVHAYDAESYHDLDPFELAREGNVDALAQVLATGEDPNRVSADGESERAPLLRTVSTTRSGEP